MVAEPIPSHYHLRQASHAFDKFYFHVDEVKMISNAMLNLCYTIAYKLINQSFITKANP